MAVQSEIFSTEYGVRSFISTKHIATKQHMSVWLQRRSDNIWFQLSTSNYELINNSAVLTQAPNSTIYSQVEIRVADTPDELGSSQSEIAVLAGLYDEIVALNGIKNDITTVASMSGDVTTVSSNISDINSVVTNIVPNLNEILQADTNATIATTKAAEASASATSASNSATTATNQATIATTKASEASASASSASNSAMTSTTKATEASASATSASNSATSASSSANTATTKANEASASASLASASANNASTSETMAYKWSSNPVDTIVETDKYSAFHWATKAQQWASTVDTTNFVDRTTDQSISGVKTFTSSPIVPDATTATQVVNKGQLDTKQDALVSGTSIKTINNMSLLGSGNISTTPPYASQTVAGLIEIATNAEVQDGTDTIRAVTPAGMKAGLNATGTAPIYACRAWVNFNGTGTVSIRASGNVSSITDNEVGSYTVNFTTAMPDVNYSMSGLAEYNNNGSHCVSTRSGINTTTTAKVIATQATVGGGIYNDNSWINVSIFR